MVSYIYRCRANYKNTEEKGLEMSKRISQRISQYNMQQVNKLFLSVWLICSSTNSNRQYVHTEQNTSCTHRTRRRQNTRYTHLPSKHDFNPLTPNDLYMSRTAPLTSNRCILYTYSTNVGTEYFKHAQYSPFFSLQNAVCFIMLTFLVPVLFTFYIQGVLKLKKNNSGAKRLRLIKIHFCMSVRLVPRIGGPRENECLWGKKICYKTDIYMSIVAISKGLAGTVQQGAL